MPFKLHLRI